MGQSAALKAEKELHPFPRTELELQAAVQKVALHLLVILKHVSNSRLVGQMRELDAYLIVLK